MTAFSVLFVDDEPITRKITARLLGRHYTVFEAEGGKTALRLLEENSREIDVIVTDMKMEDMDGITLIKRIAADYPGIPVIASSGDLSNYDFDSLIDQGKLHATIEKPWNLDQALAAISLAIGSACKSG